MTMSDKTKFPQTWNMDIIFPNSGQEKDYQDFIHRSEKDLIRLKQSIDEKNIIAATTLLQNLYQDLSTLSAYSVCLFSENTTNTRASAIQETYRQLEAGYNKLSVQYDLILKEFSDQEFSEFLKDPKISPIAFYINEKRAKAKNLLTLKEEELISDLSIDGYHGFSQMFDTLHGNLKFELDGETFSYSQIENKLFGNKRTDRIKAFYIFKKVFKDNENNFAQILNHIAGFRLKIYEKRGWDDPLTEPLINNRMQKATLDAMLKSIQSHSSVLKLFMQRKAHLMNIEKLSWHDVDCSLKKDHRLIPYDQACELILSQFAKCSPDLARFSEKALGNHWIDAEDRTNKAAGGFCIGFPKAKTSRIFMTYSGSEQNVSTLAHELGHAYHNEVIFPLPPFAQTIKMNIAETASTMAEMIMSDALYHMAQTSEEKIVSLDDKISRAIAFCMNLQARFTFEIAFYQERKKGYVPPDRLCSLMEKAQKEAYLNSLSEYHPHFWASKLHFYFTDEPFYNFPYIFGFLFSLSCYELTRKNPKDFEKVFRDLLKDSAQMNVEDLAKKHLNADLTQPLFWDIAMQTITKQVHEFLSLTEKGFT